LKVEGLKFESQSAPLQPITFSFELSAPAKVKLVYRGASQGETSVEPRDRGPQQIVWNPAGLPNGTYEVSIDAGDGVDAVSSAVVQVPMTGTVTSPSPSPLTRAPDRDAKGGDGSLWLILGIVGGALIAIGVVLLFRIRRTRRSS
jgi:hypothetical protein